MLQNRNLVSIITVGKVTDTKQQVIKNAASQVLTGFQLNLLRILILLRIKHT